MGTEIIALKECWDNILKAFREFGFSEEELQPEIFKEGATFVIIFSKRLFDELRRVNLKHKDELCDFFNLDVRFDPQVQDGCFKIITKRGWMDISVIQCAMAFARPEFAAEKRKRIENHKIMLDLELEDAIKGHKYFGYKKADVFYKKGDFYVKVRFSRRGGCIKKIPKPWENKKLFSPEGILMEFKAYLDTLL